MRRFLFTITLLTVSLSVSAHELTLTISAYRGSADNPDANAVVGGSTVQAWVTFRLEPNIPDWAAYLPANPDFRDIKFDLLLDGKSTSVESRPVTFYTQQILRERWLSNPSTVDSALWRNDVVFAMDLPQVSTAMTCQIRAQIASPKYGKLVSNQVSLKLCPASNKSDSLKIVQSEVYSLHLSQDFDHARQLADSVNREYAELEKKRGMFEFPDSVIDYAYFGRIFQVLEPPPLKYGPKVLYPWQVLDPYFDVPAPQPNPLRDYHDLILDEAHVRLTTAKAKDAKFPDPFAPKKMGDLYITVLPPISINTVTPGTATIGTVGELRVTWMCDYDFNFVALREPEFGPQYEGIDYMGEKQGWPPGLKLRVGVRDNENSEFKFSDNYFRALEFKLKIYDDDRNVAELWRKRDKRIGNRERAANREIFVSFTVPESFSGKQIIINGSYDHERFGHFENVMEDSANTFQVRGAITAEEKSDILFSRLEQLIFDNEYARAIQLTDSAMKQGLGTAEMMDKGMIAARFAGDKAAAIRFLDFKYFHFGLSSRHVFAECGTPPIQMREPEPPNPEINRNLYFQIKNSILNKTQQTGEPIARPQVQTDIYGPRGGACDDSPYSVMAGTHQLLRFYLMCPIPDSIPALPKEKNKRLGFSFQVCATDSITDDFVEDTFLETYLSIPVSNPDPEYKETWTDHDGNVFANGFGKEFPFIPHEKLINKYLRFRLHYYSEKGWAAHSEEVWVKIIPVCSPADSNLIVAQDMYYRNVSKDFESVIAIADSAITAGNYDPEILFYGREAAHDAKRFEDALAIIDLAWKKNGFVNPIPRNTKPFGDEEEKIYRTYKYQILRHWKANGDGPQDLMPPRKKDKSSEPDADPGEDSNIIEFTDYHSNIGKSK